MIAGPKVRLLALAVGLLLGGCVGSDRATAQGPEGLLREGRYDEALEALRARHDASREPETGLALATILMEVGRYDEAEALLRREIEAEPVDDLHLLLGRLLVARGRPDEADREFEAAMAGSRGTALLAELHRGEILLRRGEREAALSRFDRFIDVYNTADRLDSRELQAVAGAVRHLGILSSGLVQDALRAYDEAIAADPENLEAHLALGFLFLERYNVPDARASFREVLNRRSAHPMALYGLAEAAYLEGGEESAPLLEQALETNPALVPALVLRARTLLGAEDLDGAERDIEAALDVDPTSSQALAVLAAARMLQGEIGEFNRLRDRALEMNPRDADFFVTAAELVSRGRFYEQAVELAAQGAALDSLAWNAVGVQGQNQLRTGEMAGGRANLETAFRGDPFNIWIKNTLDLLDAMDDFESFESERMRVFVDPEDGGALATYMLEVGERAYDALAARYRDAPPPPIRIEAFRRSADFSVRTMGLTGLGALGVSFGNVLAMDSPAARGQEGFHWASTLWHEMAHAFHLDITDHRVPRWFSEGLAVHEEKRAGPGWGMRPNLPFFAAYLDDRLRTPSELSRSFVRPRFPEEVGFAYILGSIVMEWIEAEWGFDAILGMLEGYRDRLAPEAVIERRLGLDVDAFDRRFDAWFRERYAGGLAAAEAAMELQSVPPAQRMGDRGWLEDRVAASPSDVESRVALASLLLEEGPEEAIALLEEARAVFPENPDPRGPNRLLVEVHRRGENDAAAVEALVAHLANVSGDYRGHLLLADFLEDRGDVEGAAVALEEALNVYPFEIAVHQRLAEFYRTLGEGRSEVRERQVLLALNPADRAGALYDLADAQFRAGDMEGARTSVLGALEIAPRFPEAQELLLRIVRGT